MLLAKDIMSTRLITADKSLSVFAAAALMTQHSISGIPVVDRENNLLGIFTEYDVLRILKETTPEQPKTVEDFMTRKVVSFEEQTPMMKIWEFFLENPAKRRVPIVQNGKLAGVVSRGDIVRQIVKIHPA